MSAFRSQEMVLPPQGPPNTPAPGGPPSTPAPGGAPPFVVVGGVMTRVPQTASELSALREQRSELSNQLNSAAGRREELVKELEGAAGSSRAGIEARIRLLDQRILQIESDIASTGQLLTTALGTNIPTAPRIPRPPGMPDDIVPIIAILSVFVFAPIAIAYARSIWRRGTFQKVDSQLERENADRLTRLESAIDSIAIEMERVSEGQRFVTKLLAESKGREPVRIETSRQ